VKEVFDLTLNESLDDFMNYYKVVDDKEVYSNGTEFVPIFRVKQWYEYNNKDKEIERLNNQLEQEKSRFKAVNNNSFLISNRLKEQQEEIDRLNNIINELVKFMDEDYEYYEKYGYAEQGHAMGQISRIKNKLQELKGSD